MELNNIVIRDARADEWESAMELAYKTFLKFEAPVYGKEGTDSFLRFISDERLYKMFTMGIYKVAVAKKEDTIVGVASLRSGCHVSLLFVDEKHHREGIGRKLLSFLQTNYRDANAEDSSVTLTVNAAPYAVDFYKKTGFFETDTMQEAEGITYIPMTCLKRI